MKKNKITVTVESKVVTTLDFAKAISKRSVDAKLKASQTIQKAISTGIGIDGKVLNDGQIASLEQLNGWLMVNTLVGDEMCPPETLTQY